MLEEITSRAAADLERWGRELRAMAPVILPSVEVTAAHLNGTARLPACPPNIIYMFEFAHPDAAAAAIQDYAGRPRRGRVVRRSGQEAEANIAYAPRSGNSDSDCLYVGSCTSGRMAERFRAHMCATPETGALHLSRWMSDACLPLRLVLLNWPHANPTMLHLLENRLWSARRPLFGEPPLTGDALEDCH